MAIHKGWQPEVLMSNSAVGSAIIPNVARILRVLAPNPGPFTLEGTNTWIVGARPSLVVDPGPDDPRHLDEVRGTAEPVGAILLSHQHPDHAAGAAPLARRTGAPVLAFRPGPGEHELQDGTLMPAGGAVLRAVHTPGHTADHVVFFERETGALFTGDAVLGRGTSMIDPPEGDMAAYMGSLLVMLGLTPKVIYPGHGSAIWSAMEKLHEYVAHREDRERQVLAELKKGPRSAEEIVPSLYSDHPKDLFPAAARSVLAHLIKLEQEGRVARTGPEAEQRFALFARATGNHRPSNAADGLGKP